MTPSEIKSNLVHHGLITIVRGDFAVEQILQMAEQLLSEGVVCLEVTLNSTHALKAIGALREQFGRDMFIGAGTVRTADDVKIAIDAGSTYLIAPSLDLAAVAESQRLDTLLIPGIFTATEAQTAYLAGCGTVKLFPADASGPSYLKALRGPLDHIDFIPTGGVNVDTIGPFHRAGAVAFGVGTALVKNVTINQHELSALKNRARNLKRALDEARREG